MTTEEQNVQYTEQEEKIFHAALLAFAEHGKEGATIQDIADKAGINKALVHYYFRSKEKLYDTVFKFVMGRYFLGLARSIEAEEDFPSMLRTFISRYLDLLRAHPELPRFLFGEVVRNPEGVYQRLHANVPAMETDPFKVFSHAMNRAIERGEIRAADPMHTFISTIGATIVAFIMYPIGQAIIPGLRENLADVIEQRKQHIFDLIYNGLRP